MTAHLISIEKLTYYHRKRPTKLINFKPAKVMLRHLSQPMCQPMCNNLSIPAAAATSNQTVYTS